jgi:hypothetical protein
MAASLLVVDFYLHASPAADARCNMMGDNDETDTSGEK